MKSLIVCASVALSAILALPASSQTTITDSQGLVYNIISEPSGEMPGTCKVGNNSLFDESGEVIIPPSVTYQDNQYTVVGISSQAFVSNRTLTSIDLSGCTELTTIGDSAFYNCLALTSVGSLSGLTSLQTIGNYAFRGCNKLTSIDLSGCSALLNLGDNAFNYCEGLTSVDLSGCSSLLSIGNNAFNMAGSFDALTEVDLSGCTALQTIGDYAFYDCRALISVDMSECTSLKSIGKYVFDSCISLQLLKFPESLEEIGMLSMRGCSSLENVYCYAVVPPATTGNLMTSTITTTGSLWVPRESVEAYRENQYWGVAKYIKFITEIPITSIELSLSDFTIAEDADPVEISATIAPDDATYPELSWSVEPEDIVEIIPDSDPDNILSISVKPLAPGEVTLTATAGDYSDVTGSCKITVVSISEVEIGLIDSGTSEWISIMTEGAEMRVGETLSLSVRTTPAVDFAPTILWASSESFVADFFANADDSLSATLQALSVGQTDILVSMGNQTVTASITVLPELTSEISISPSELTLDDGASETLTVEFTPAGAEPGVDWRSSDETVISIVPGLTDRTATVFALRPGTATVTVKTTDGSELTSTCAVTVVAVPVEKLSLGIEDVTLDVQDAPLTLTVTIEPAEATLPSLVWESSEADVASVSSLSDLSATLTPLTAGTTTVKVSLAEDASVYDTAEVTVTDKSSLGDIFSDGTFDDGAVDVYDLSGRLIRRHATEEQLQELRPGVYIFRQGTTSRKIMIQ